MNSFISRLYQDSDILIRKKVRAIFLTLATMLGAFTFYFLVQLISSSGYRQDLLPVAFSLLMLGASLIFLLRGHYYISTILILVVTLAVSTALVWSGHTLNELKLYNMAFLHSLGIIYAVLIAEKPSQILFYGLSSFLCISLFLFFRLLPAARGNLFPYYSTFSVVVLVELIETVTGYLTFRILNNSLREIKRAAEFDAETGLPNESRLTIDIRQKELYGDSFFLVLFKLENYRELLLNTGNENTLESILICSGIASDHFESSVYRVSVDMVCIPVNFDLEETEKGIGDMLESFRMPIRVNDMSVHLHVRATMLTGDRRTFNVQECVSNSLLALYQVKREKKFYIPFEESRQKVWKERLSVQSELSEAISEQCFSTVYQPIFDGHKNIAAYEALCRWTNKEGKKISPGLFIPMLEQSGLIDEFSLRMMTALLKEMKEFESLAGDFPVFMNLSPELINHNFDFSRLIRLIDDAGVPHKRIGFEITESTILDDEKQTAAVIDYLRSQEFSLALDDFGTGYSNMARILHLPFNKIKFDMTFLHSLKEDAKNSDLLELLISYFNDKGFITVIEGVETGGEFNLLKEFGCREFQGFLLGRPEPPK